MRRFSLLIPLLGGCLPEFASLDEACKEEIRGEKHGSDEADDAFNRMVCYRRMSGLSGGHIDKHVQEAVTAHASYLSNNGTLGDWSAEDPSLPGYTGATDMERLDVAGMSFEDVDVGLWFWVITDTFDPYPAETMTDRIDLWMGEPYYRQVILQPSFRGAGLAHVGEVWYGTVAYDMPPEQHAGTPVMYPTDGQSDIPTTWLPAGLAPDTGITPGVLMGFPVTIIAATTDAELVFGNLTDPLGLTVRNAELEGPDGVVPVVVILPSTATGPFMYTAAFVPTAPLAPSETYTFTGTVAWADKEKDVTTTFTTAAE